MPLLKQLNNSEFNGIKERLELARDQLQGIQAQMSTCYSDDLATEEKQTLEKLEKQSLIEENILQQKARTKWIRLGYANSKYFSAIMKERRQRKVITELVYGFGDKITDQQQIQAEIINFYKSLMGSIVSQLPTVNKQVMKNGPVLNHMQQINLCAEVTDQEFYEGLCAIGDNKAPGVDGYNALFFKKSWSIISSKICQAVKGFFYTWKLYRAVNCTAITIIPKVRNPSSIKEYRPIACCTVLYKLIAKILANRIQKVIATIISDTQAGFIPSRKVVDNIILAHELVKAYSRKNISPRCLIKVDTQKAYDTVDWRYLHQMLEELGFPTMFIR